VRAKELPSATAERKNPETAIREGATPNPTSQNQAATQQEKKEAEKKGTKKNPHRVPLFRRTS